MLNAANLATYRAELWLLSPSCQPYTVLNPLAKGAADPRAKSFIHLIEDVLPEMVRDSTHPKYMLVENVAGFERSSTRLRLLKTLDSLGYGVLELLLTPLQFGIPNSRLRYYLLAKAQPMPFPGTIASGLRLWRHIPGHGQDWIDPRMYIDHNDNEMIADEIRDYLDEDVPERHSTHPNAIPDQTLQKWGRLFDIILPSARRSCCFTRGYVRMAERSGSVLQMNEELDTTSTFDRFLEAQKSGREAAVRVLDPLRLRYFSPTELLRIFHFLPTAKTEAQESFQWPADLSVKTQYRLIGNSVNVQVVAELIRYLFEVEGRPTEESDSILLKRMAHDSGTLT
ncbi:uncharacterized protein FIBRA_00325 [Fibroporia radiculosa]|uniref:tRNA (cytosine(38)-C(5))-methyltransferase n=1 Tax=Fibroporia radiculosa TaxID=599839 RepID=J7SC11_9APHY|nr:uncharacterized protein FIBRA_00325 [Fibroporia radiculosa]CCL98331.1 predicted protein [Fibroporia radiculosa]